MRYEIKSFGASAVVGSDGAQLNSLVKDGREYLWQGDSRYWSGQAPVCFPIVGVLPDGRADAFGKPCVMKRHGVARINPFELAEKLKNSVTFIQKSSDATRACFPFDYELKISYTIVLDTVSVQYTVKNTGADKMPFAIGGHPAFNCPIDSDENFEDYKVVFDRPVKSLCMRPDHVTGLVDTSKTYNVMHGGDTLVMRHDLFEDKDALIFENCPSKMVTLIGKNGRGVRLDFQDMNNLLIWSAEGKAPFAALEPWSGISSCLDEDGLFEHKRGITVLGPGEITSFKYKITMI